MKAIPVLVSLSFILARASASFFSFNGNQGIRRFFIDTPESTEQWITQKVDNFDPSNTKTWQMRYFKSFDHFQPGGPIFILIGGESGMRMVSGLHVQDMVKEFNGAFFVTEHRYYGKSIPDRENLQYLSSDQALADLKNFIIEMKNSRAELKTAKVFVVGGSYAGTLAAWMRQKYPELVDGAWASSAPLVAKADFPEYLQTAEKSIELVGGRKCIKKIKKTCNLDDLKSLSGLAQLESKGQIEKFCKSLIGQGYGPEVCNRAILELYGPNYRLMTQEDQTSWIFQTCSEFGWFQTPKPTNKLFVRISQTLEQNYENCKQKYPGFGFNAKTIEENIRNTNQKHLGLNLTTTKVYYTQGQLDPWKMVGLQESPNEDMPVTVIPFETHCKDLGSISITDSDELKQAKLRATELAKKWLQ